MHRSLVFRAVALGAILAASASLSFDGWRSLSVSPAMAQNAKPADRDAFEAAKELGTAEAWRAFLSSYPTGFYSDLARAYLKKDGGEAAGPKPSAPVQAETKSGPTVLPPSSDRASERPCSQRTSLRSEHSREPTTITFVNRSGMFRGIMWLDYQGHPQDVGNLNSGEQMTIETFRTHPWMIVTGPGDCLQVFITPAGAATVELVRQPADGPVKQPAAAAPKPAPKPVAAPLVCAKNYVLQNGRCVLVQNCGANAYRSPEGDCYCQKGYQMQGGRCVWPKDKQGFEVAPWNKPGCSTLQNQCKQGNGPACIKYEENCQVN